MSARFESYRFRDGKTPLAERTFNPIFRDVDLRLAALEAVRIAWDEAVDIVTGQGLLRINEALSPAFSQLNTDIAAVQAQIAALPDVALKADLAEPSAEAITYNANGDVIHLVDTVNGAPVTTDITYDANGNVATVIINDGTVTRTETYSYDGNGVLTGMAAVEV